MLSCWTSLFLIAAQADTNEKFVDPLPPRVHRLEAQAPPAPSDHEGLTFHRPPKPLRADAKTEDSPGFLGPRRTGHLGETKLARNWDGEGPPLVWSLERGEGSYLEADVAALDVEIFDGLSPSEAALLFDDDDEILDAVAVEVGVLPLVGTGLSLEADLWREREFAG